MLDFYFCISTDASVGYGVFFPFEKCPGKLLKAVMSFFSLPLFFSEQRMMPPYCLFFFYLPTSFLLFTLLLE